jgi:hypothetical protein
MVLIGFYPILNDDALSGLRLYNRFQELFLVENSKNPERVIAFRIG